ncbi:hypothetical protein NPIL_514911 [Nephila pilipes]|uniref:Uncharacterized protein n=1 Tax=Nephila pilipes TaxID=299642 RepID=A0A8X6TFU5_NEPPI|nr:hypothetical protein NPIL_514911 [Nephila pilipes]
MDKKPPERCRRSSDSSLRFRSTPYDEGLGPIVEWFYRICPIRRVSTSLATFVEGARKKKSQLSTSAENSAAVLENYTTIPENSDDVPEKIFLPPKESESTFQKKYTSFNLSNNDNSPGISTLYYEFLLLRKEETDCIFRNEFKTYKSLKVSNWVHCIYLKDMQEK